VSRFDSVLDLIHHSRRRVLRFSRRAHEDFGSWLLLYTDLSGLWHHSRASLHEDEGLLVWRCGERWGLHCLGVYSYHYLELYSSPAYLTCCRLGSEKVRLVEGVLGALPSSPLRVARLEVCYVTRAQYRIAERTEVYLLCSF
jgi:hypothetical protein